MVVGVVCFPVDVADLGVPSFNISVGHLDSSVFFGRRLAIGDVLDRPRRNTTRPVMNALVGEVQDGLGEGSSVILIMKEESES